MAEARVGATSTVLRDGRVLVAGGFADGEGNDARASAEIYDAATRTWTRTGDMLGARAGHSATLLKDGTVLVAGGGTSPTHPVDTSETFDPASGSWSAAGKLHAANGSPAATPLLDGRLLVAGGDKLGVASAAAELYDPAKRKWTATGSLVAARSGATATLLWTGRVLVVGGADGTTPLSSAELFDPYAGTWSATGPMAEPRAAHAMALLDDGRVLVAGGLRGGLAGDLVPDDILTSAERFDPATEEWTAAGPMVAARFQFTLTTLADGGVLAASGDHLGTGPVRGSEHYDARANTWSPAGSLVAPRAAQTAALLDDGDVLLAGGEGPGARGLSSTEVYDGPPPPAATRLATSGTMFPGVYRTAFDPPMTIEIDHQVDLDCSPGYRCRGDIDVNLEQWVGFEFGNVHGSELDIQRLDKVYAGAQGDALVDVPDDLAAWILAQPGVTEVTPAVEVSVGGLPGKRLELRADRDVRFGPSGITEFPWWGIGPNSKRTWLTVVNVGSVGVLIWDNFGPENTAGDFAAIVQGLQPVIDSITWE
jgi:hypothetical protein